MYTDSLNDDRLSYGMAAFIKKIVPSMRNVKYTIEPYLTVQFKN